MSKLFKLKKWLTLDEAAEHLASVLHEKVSIQDVLRLALDRHIVLSINLVNGASACKGRRIPIAKSPLRVAHAILTPSSNGAPPWGMIEGYPSDDSPEAQWRWCAENQDRFSSGELIAFPAGSTYTSEFSYLFDKEVSTIRGLWDLPMIGGEILDVVHLLQQFIDGPDVTGTYLDGAFLVHSDGETFAHLMEHFSENEYVKDGQDREKYPWGDPRSYYPAAGLPNEEQLVVRTEKLADFLLSLQDDSNAGEKPLDERERGSLLRIIRALDAMANLPTRGAATSIETQLQQLGFSKPSEATIRKLIEQARALEPDNPQ